MLISSTAQHMSENNAISAFDLVSVPLREVRTVCLDCAYFTPPLTATAYSPTFQANKLLSLRKAKKVNVLITCEMPVKNQFEQVSVIGC